jgi:hypothetical protein
MEKDKENKDGKNPSGVLETIGDLQDYIKKGVPSAAGDVTTAAQDIMNSAKKKGAK